jgi:hypothetical protein
MERNGKIIRSISIGEVGRVLLGAFLISALLLACEPEKKMEPVAVGEMEEYKDPGIGFRISHPKDWVVNAEVGRARFYNAPEVDTKFLDPTSVGALGVEISVDVVKTADPADNIRKVKDDMLASGIVIKQEDTVTVAGVPGKKIVYAANYGGGNIIYGHHVLVATDSAVYDLGFAGFGDHYDAYAAVYDASLNSLKLPKPKVKGRDETLPSETFDEYDAKIFKFQYPDNFNFTNPTKGKNELVLELRGYRQDCTIRFDVFGAQGLTAEKVFDQNKARYRSKSTGKTSISNLTAYFVADAPTPQVERKTYFTVHNDKVIRITMNWYKPQRDAYLTAYDKVLGSIRFN